jgi:hypothetical protein
METDNRHVVWFSCGAASAVTAYLAVKEGLNPMIVYCDTLAEEHPDNVRFLQDVANWLDRCIILIRSEYYLDISDVFQKTKYMSGIAGARCTTEMKKIPRRRFQREGDIHYFGLTADEERRIKLFEGNNPDLKLRWLLAEYGLTKQDCLNMLPMPLPAMYRLGFDHNNCIGCVKATSPKYWNQVREHFPDIFDKRAKQSREIGCRLARVKGKRVFLDELPINDSTDNGEKIECGVTCQNE